MTEVLVITLGGLALAAGLALFFPLRRGAGGMPSPTRMTLGFCLALLGYHLLAWTLPAHWLPLRIPAERWPLLAGGAILALAASLAADLLERRR